MNSDHDSNRDSTPDDAARPQGCAPFLDDLPHLVLGELAPERVAAVEAHCASCADCRAERELLTKSAQLLRRDATPAAPVLQLSTARQQALLEAAARTAPVAPLAPVRRFWNPRRALAAAAAIAAVAIGSQWLWRGYDVAPQRNGTESTYELASIQPPVGLGAPLTPTNELADRLSAAAQSGDRDAAQWAITELAATDVSLSVEQLASLSIELAQADQSAAAIELLKQAPPEMQLDSESRMKLRRVAAFVAAKAPADDTSAGLAQLNALGYLGSESEAVLDAGLVDDGVDELARRELARGAAAAASTPAAAVASSLETTLDALGYVGPVDEAKALEEQRDLKSLLTLARESVPAPATDSFFTDLGDGSASVANARARLENLFELSEESIRSLDSIPQWDRGVDDYGVGLPQLGASIAASIPQLATLAPSELFALEASLGRAAAAGARLDVDAVVKSCLDQLAPRQGEPPRDMFFRWFGDHPFVPTRVDTLSTFGMDVDTASYNLVRSYLEKGTLPPKVAVRTEEFVNAFRQELAAPAADSNDVFAITTELAPSPFGGEGRHLLRVGLKAREIAKEARKPAALTFILDVSGSMEEGGRLELVKQSLRLLVAQLDERDTIGIVVFSENARRALPPTRASDAARIFAVLDSFRPEQSTNADAGLRLGYEMAVEQLRPDADNRVILCSDGVANAGITDPAWLSARIRECKGKRIYLTSIGVGMGNHNDALMEQLADEGDGQCHYVDDLAEAKQIFVDGLTGTLSTVARDAKIQVEFDPLAVRAFRQLGYENRAIAHANFRNDRVDAGEVGAGQSVVALYEVELAADATGPLATVRCRYEDPRNATVREQARLAFAAESGATVAAMPARWRLDAAVAEFAELLRQSVHARDGSFGAVERLAEPLVAELPGDADVAEFVALVKQAARLPDLLPRRTELTRCVDEIKKVRCWQRELEQSDPPQRQANSALMQQLEEQNRKLEQALRDALANAANAR